ncbi:MAG: hypothetical protein E8D50_08925 [Nitrospira sp.]|nr:MAG: hypothetical protein E8D50_08925 [Nitrospira sp.]
MRICSLLPSATEVIAALGLRDELVGVSHECDYPPSVRSVPIMVEPMIPSDGLASAALDILIVMPCGFSVERTHAEMLQLMQQPGQWQLSPTLAEHTYLVDASSYFSRPGPRLIDGIELLAAILHPSDHHPIHESMARRLGPLPIHQHP